MKFIYLLFIIAIAITGAQAVTIVTHTIQGKETIPMLAKKYCTSKIDIEKRNNLKPNKYVQRGTVLKIAMNTMPNKKEKIVIRRGAAFVQIASKNVHSLDTVRKNSRVVAVKKQPINVEKQVAGNYIAEEEKSSVHTLDEIRKNLQLDKKTYASKSKPEAANRIVRQTLAVENRKVHTLESVKKDKKLLVTSKKPKKASPKRVTVNDITFKSSRSSVSSTSNNKDVNKIINLAKQKLGRRYVWGAVGEQGTFDCSGFTSYLYKKVGINIPRTSRNQAKYGKYIARSNLKKGDLIFFDTSKHRKGYVNHVGIYLGNGKFIHASSAQKKVTISNLSKFYAQRYVGARRPS